MLEITKITKKTKATRQMDLTPDHSLSHFGFFGFFGYSHGFLSVLVLCLWFSLVFLVFPMCFLLLHLNDAWCLSTSIVKIMQKLAFCMFLVTVAHF